MDINSDIHWQVRLRNAVIGNSSLQVSVDKLIFDTGSSLCYMPQRDYQQFIAEIKRNTNCFYDADDKMVYCDCES